ncbi:succinate dehydrogenase/fumarate reductase iron-sulfur subunit [Sporolactobacillus sp. KGMB 08714]|uniref:succinate dehydrogenase/fumarate reductase iron-sulfur subunit n=1 Tax=Sporolactobacillus sp. KGMB 08714 TaxID=3064704 RepID=UPI002FBE2E91
MEKLKIKIKRFNGKKTWYQTYVIPYEKGRTILWSLTTIRETLDSSLVYTSACQHGICGSCAIKVNGKSFLACQTPLDRVIDIFKTELLTYEPLTNFPVIRDLAVAWETKMEKMKKIRPWLIPSEKGTKERGFLQSQENFHKIASSTDCILCGICASECNQLRVNGGTFLDPFVWNRAYRYTVDTRDGSPEKHVEPAYKNGLWKCLHCMECVSNCPKKIDLTEEISALRKISMKMGETNNQGARHAFAFFNDVRKTGRLNEVMLPIKTDGMLHTAATKVPFALRMIKTGKINPLEIPRKVEGIEEVKNIYEYAEEEKKQ